ncbi:MAG: protein kinase [Gammaproteobacteria bacterium]|nr:protein kinase [Gammaproteobacteria bacterium]
MENHGLKLYSGTLHLWPFSNEKLRRNRIPYPDAAAPPKELIITGPTLGKGSFGTVVRGLFKTRPVAIKKLHLSNPKTHQLILNEYQIHQQLNHPNIVTLISGKQKEEHIYFILELMPNGTLNALIHNRTFQLNEETRKNLLHDIAKGLDYLHENGILHRDIKPENILLNHQMRAKISDFGIAIYIARSYEHIREHTGTPNRIAPELTHPKSPWWYTPATDIYAFGILVSELVRRASPYDAYGNITLMQLFELIQNGIRDSIPYGTSEELATLITTCSAQEPSSRPSTKKILDILSATPPKHVNASPPSEKPITDNTLTPNHTTITANKSEDTYSAFRY